MRQRRFSEDLRNCTGQPSSGPKTVREGSSSGQTPRLRLLDPWPGLSQTGTRVGLAAVARVAAAGATTGDRTARTRPLTAGQGERARRHSAFAGNASPSLQRSWRFIPATTEATPTPRRSRAEPRDPTPLSGGPGTLPGRAPALATAVASSATPARARPALARVQSALRVRSPRQERRAQSADTRRPSSCQAEEEDLAPIPSIPVEATSPGPLLQAPRANDANDAAPRGVAGCAERQGCRAGHHPVLTAAPTLSPSLRRPVPFKSLTSAAFGGRYGIGRYLGRGASATVWEATHEDTKHRVAVKVFDQGSRDRRQAHREMRILSRIKHPAVVEAYEVVETMSCAQIVCELIDGESLRAFTQRQEGHRLQDETARCFYQQVVEGIQYCHERLVVHRDLKLENLLLDKRREIVKIIDFGFAAQVATKDAKLRAFCGTPSYMAPEIIRGEGYSGFATDIWALGVVVFALLVGSLPFVGRTELQLYAKIRRGVFTCPDALGELPRRLVRAALRMDATTRPSVTGILRHVWICGSVTPPLATPLAAPSQIATSRGDAGDSGDAGDAGVPEELLSASLGPGPGPLSTLDSVQSPMAGQVQRASRASRATGNSSSTVLIPPRASLRERTPLISRTTGCEDCMPSGMVPRKPNHYVPVDDRSPSVKESRDLQAAPQRPRPGIAWGGS